MALTVEDGTVVVGADSYVSVADATAYHVERGNNGWLTAAGVLVSGVTVSGAHPPGVSEVTIASDGTGAFSLVAGDRIELGDATPYIVAADTGPVGFSSTAEVEIVPSLRAPKAGGEAVTLSETLQESALRYATLWLDNRYDWVGFRTSTITDEDRLDWPRDRAWTREGRQLPRDEIPVPIIHATAEAALEHLNSILHEVRERGGNVLSHGVGPIFQQYGGGAPSGRTFPYIDRLLRDIIVSGPGSSLMIRG